MTASTVVDVSGGPAGGAARFRNELYRYLTRNARQDVHIIGDERRVAPAWLIRREVLARADGRRVAINNVGFVSPRGERWTLLRNALHFLTDEEESGLHPSIRTANRRKARIVRVAARRADVLVVPCTAMADRVIRAVPGRSQPCRGRLHPVSAELIQQVPRDSSILCPVLFAPYKHMTERLTESGRDIDGYVDPSVKLCVTAASTEFPPHLAVIQGSRR